MTDLTNIVFRSVLRIVGYSSMTRDFNLIRIMASKNNLSQESYNLIGTVATAHNLNIGGGGAIFHL